MGEKRRGLAERRKRALYRACHRGTKEMDWFLGRFARAKVESMDGFELATFEMLLALPDPDIEDWLGSIRPSASGGELKGLIGRLRAFHGIEP